MAKLLSTSFRISAYVTAGLMALPVVVGQKDLVSAFLFAMLFGIPGWLAMGTLMAICLWVTSAPEPRRQIRPVGVTIRSTRLRDDPPVSPEPAKREKININFGGY